MEKCMPVQTISTLETFLEQLSSARRGLLMLDFDGTLAPFAVDRKKVRIYAPATELLDKIRDRTDTRVVLISGRSAHELRDLLPQPCPEIWGSHGMERLWPDGSYDSTPTVESINQAFEAACAVVDSADLGEMTERKVGCLAVHWRGQPTERQALIRSTALKAWSRIAAESGIAISEFDGGLELRVPMCDKGHAVRTVLDECPKGTPAAYLGDDVTDEAAFHAIAGMGLAILVRSERRLTAAQMWLRPPDDLVDFLAQWLRACGGAQ
jgi:trehalose 6-phosphate phosphatase